METVGFVTREQYSQSLANITHSLIRNSLVKTDERIGKLYWPQKNRRASEHWSRMFELPWAIEASGTVAGMSCLDVGSGFSPLPVFLAQRGAGVLSLDLKTSGDLRAILLDCEGARCQEGNILTWEPREKFDRIFCISVLEHVRGNVLTAIDHMRSWLTDRGRLILTMDVGLPGGVCGFPVADCRELAAHCGVSVPNPDVKTLVSSSDFDDASYVGSDIGIFYLVL